MSQAIITVDGGKTNTKKTESTQRVQTPTKATDTKHVLVNGEHSYTSCNLLLAINVIKHVQCLTKCTNLWAQLQVSQNFQLFLVPSHTPSSITF